LAHHSGDGNGKAVLQAVGRIPMLWEQTIVNDDEKADTDMRMRRLPLLCGLLVFLLLSGCDQSCDHAHPEFGKRVGGDDARSGTGDYGAAAKARDIRGDRVLDLLD
jgi:hypothetical protein